MMIWILLAALSQTPPTANVTDSIMWEYPQAQLDLFQVEHFRVIWDSQEPVHIRQDSRQAGTDTYSVRIPSLQPGQHLVTVAACRLDNSCSNDEALQFLLDVRPNGVVNLRLAKSGG